MGSPCPKGELPKGSFGGLVSLGAWYLKGDVPIGVGVLVENGVTVGIDARGVGVLVGDDVLVGVGVEVKVGVGAISLLVGVGIDGSGVAVGGGETSVGVGETIVGRLKDGRFKGRKKRAKAAMATTAPLTPTTSHVESLLLPNS